MVLKFTKDKNLSMPEDLIFELEELSEEINIGDYDQQQIENHANRLKDLIKQKVRSDEITKKMADNANFYIVLCKNYVQYNELDDRSIIDMALIKRLNKWNTYANNISSNWGFRKFGISKVYDPHQIRINRTTTLKYERYAKLYLPYSLTNKLILHSVSMQEEIHDYVAGFINATPDDQSIKSNLKKLFYEKEVN